MDHDRLDGLRQGAYGAPERTNVVITVADFRWLVDQLTDLAPPRQIASDDAAPLAIGPIESLDDIDIE